MTKHLRPKLFHWKYIFIVEVMNINDDDTSDFPLIFFDICSHHGCDIDGDNLIVIMSKLMMMKKKKLLWRPNIMLRTESLGIFGGEHITQIQLVSPPNYIFCKKSLTQIRNCWPTWDGSFLFSVLCSLHWELFIQPRVKDKVILLERCRAKSIFILDVFLWIWPNRWQMIVEICDLQGEPSVLCFVPRK